MIRIDRNNVARYVISAGLAVIAAWSFAACLVVAVRARSDGWGTMAFHGGFGLLFAAPFASAAYFCLKRRYGDLFMVGAAVGAFVLLGLCFTLPRQFGVTDALRDRWTGGPWQALVMLLIWLVLLLGPFYLTGWFLRACSRFAARRLPNPPATSGTQTYR